MFALPHKNKKRMTDELISVFKSMNGYGKLLITGLGLETLAVYCSLFLLRKPFIINNNWFTIFAFSVLLALGWLGFNFWLWLWGSKFNSLDEISNWAFIVYVRATFLLAFSTTILYLLKSSFLRSDLAFEIGFLLIFSILLKVFSKYLSRSKLNLWPNFELELRFVPVPEKEESFFRKILTIVQKRISSFLSRF